eukprot:720535-Amphidinium_carterae.1
MRVPFYPSSLPKPKRIRNNRKRIGNSHASTVQIGTRSMANGCMNHQPKKKRTNEEVTWWTQSLRKHQQISGTIKPTRRFYYSGKIGYALVANMFF